MDGFAAHGGRDVVSTTFDAKRGRYVVDGKPVGAAQLVDMADVEIEAAQAEIDDETRGRELVTAAAIAAWLLLMGGAVTDIFIRLYALGRGGLAQMDDDDWQAVGGLIERQKQYLNGLESDLKAGRVSVAQAAARAVMYMAAARAAFESARAVAAERAKKTEEKWVITPGENCGGCVDNAGQGWVSIGTLPMPGAGTTPCRSNCRCYKVYR